MLSAWSDWSACGETCGATATRYRTRRVMVTPSGGGEDCGHLIDREECQNLPACSYVSSLPEYRWDLGDWSGCRKVSASSLYRIEYCVKNTFFKQFKNNNPLMHHKKIINSPNLQHKGVGLTWHFIFKYVHIFQSIFSYAKGTAIRLTAH